MAVALLSATSAEQADMAGASTPQAHWASLPLRARLDILRDARHSLARQCSALLGLFPSSLARTHADSCAAEVLPLLDACRFLEREAARILRPRRLGAHGRPLWLGGVHSVVERVPLGVVLVIGPANYPLFLPGVQTLQALAAGNAVIWKPGRGGEPLARYVAETLSRAGLPPGLLSVTGDSSLEGVAALQRHPAKVFFTGSSAAGQAVLLDCALRSIPAVAELSGCDACIVLPSADPARVASALEFAMRFNGSATCMAPRRLFLLGHGHEALIRQLIQRFAAVPAVRLSSGEQRLLESLLTQAAAAGATVHGSAGATSWIRPILVENGRPELRLASTDIMAPVLTAIRIPNRDALLEADRQCPFGLTASIFGAPDEALQLGRLLNVGTVVVNDLIVPTADPRVPFGGRRQSGFGVTRGAEGLLEMTAVKTTAVRSNSSVRHYEPTDARHQQLFTGWIELRHAATLRGKLKGLQGMVSAMRRLRGNHAGGTQ